MNERLIGFRKNAKDDDINLLKRGGGLEAFENGDSRGKVRLQWNRFKWILFVTNASTLQGAGIDGMEDVFLGGEDEGTRGGGTGGECGYLKSWLFVRRDEGAQALMGMVGKLQPHIHNHHTRGCKQYNPLLITSII